MAIGVKIVDLVRSGQRVDVEFTVGGATETGSVSLEVDGVARPFRLGGAGPAAQHGRTVRPPGVTLAVTDWGTAPTGASFRVLCGAQSHAKPVLP